MKTEVQWEQSRVVSDTPDCPLIIHSLYKYLWVWLSLSLSFLIYNVK